MKDKWRGLLVAVATAALLMFVWAPLACGQFCPDGRCPTPGIGSLDVGGWRASPRETQSQPNPAVCRVHVKTGYAATGVLIDTNGKHGLVMTNAHLVREKPTKVLCEFPGRKTWTGQLVRAEEAVDLALILILDPGITPVTVSTRSPTPGETVTIHGYGRGTFRAVTGPVLRYATFGAPELHRIRTSYGMRTHPIRKKIGGRANTFSVDVLTRPGDSGSPVFNRSGVLVGIVWGGDSADSEVVPCTIVDNFVLTSGQYLAPWNARIEQQQIRADADIEMEQIKAGAQPQYIMPGGSSGPDPGTQSRLGILESRVTALEGVAEAAKAAAANASTEAGKAFAEAVGVKESIVETVTAEVEKVGPGLVEKATPGLMKRVMEKFGWLNFGVPGLGLGLVGLILFIIIKDVRDYIKTGGEDKLIIQHAAALLQRGAGATRNTIDDRGTDWLAAKVDALASKLDRFSPEPPPVPPAGGTAV